MRGCRLALNTPDATGHLLDAHLALLDGAASVRGGADLALAAAAVSALAGTLYGDGSPAATAMPLEDHGRAAGDTAATGRVTALTTVCRWAAGSEEGRKVHRHRFLAAVRRWCEHHAVDPAAVTTADLLPGAAR